MVNLSQVCDECGSNYLASTSRMESLCPQCAHILYGYENCAHVFNDGICSKCHWNGALSIFIKSII
jgi:predicted RNA-binding Zn-ribbon protein involved in translation (DUF1610 family)